MTFEVSGIGRRVGAIGIFHAFSCTVEAQDDAEARLNVYGGYEHITEMKVTPALERQTIVVSPKELVRCCWCGAEESRQVAFSIGWLEHTDENGRAYGCPNHPQRLLPARR
jgi:hypothetical protein